MEYLTLFISENASFFGTYGNWVLIPLFLIILVVDNVVLKKFSITRPARWAIRTPLILMAFISGSLIYMINFPLKPMVASLSKVQNNIGQEIDDFEFMDVRKNSFHKISEFEGRVVILNFWGTYCRPCLEEFPDLKEIESAYSNQVWVIALSDEKKDRILKFVQKIQSPTIVGSFSSEEWIELENFRPVTIIIDKNGIIREYVFGKKDYNFFQSAVEKYS